MIPPPITSRCSVTQRIRMVVQPRGGYVPTKKFRKEHVGEENERLHPYENIHMTLTKLTVDYLTRYLSGWDVWEAFDISWLGADIVGLAHVAEDLLSGICGLDDRSITNAVKLTGFDVVYRAGAVFYRDIDTINPNAHTIDNIRTMVKRSLALLERYGPKTLCGFYVEGGNIENMTYGDGDFLTHDTLWYSYVSYDDIKPAHTLALLLYLRLGYRAGYPEFDTLTHLGIFNPRTATVYRMPIGEIDHAVICDVEKYVIGY